MVLKQAFLMTRRNPMVLKATRKTIETLLVWVSLKNLRYNQPPRPRNQHHQHHRLTASLLTSTSTKLRFTTTCLMWLTTPCATRLKAQATNKRLTCNLWNQPGTATVTKHQTDSTPAVITARHRHYLLDVTRKPLTRF
jgi:hypothetical protein